VLGPTCFSVFIDPLLQEVDAMTSKTSFAYADDLKFVAGANSVGSQSAQTVVNLVCQWSKSHLMPLSLDKCNVMHCGKDNPRTVYTLENQPMTCVAQFKDLGVLRIPDSTYSDHVHSVVAATSRLCGSMFHVFRTREAGLLWAAYQAYLKPKLMYAAQVWSPFLKQHIQAVEQVQRRFSKRLAGLEAMSYEERLVLLGATTLETARRDADVTLLHRCVHGKTDFTLADIGVSLSTNNNRSGKLCTMPTAFRAGCLLTEQ
jgi:hypothetical protein